MSSSMELITLAGGCFWCTEAIFKRLNGVVKVTSGYTGGLTPNPNYEQVSGGDTNHTEAVQIEFDPTIVSLKRLLDIFWATHNPTTLNRQGNDVGTQYRSAIYYSNSTQRDIALASKKEVESSGTLDQKIVTVIEPLTTFYPAESYHQNYYEINKNSNPYCSLVIDPKIEKLVHNFNKDLKEEYLNE